MHSRIGLKISGAFLPDHLFNLTNFLSVYVQLLYLDEPNNGSLRPEVSYSENITKVYRIPLVDVNDIDTAQESTRKFVFDIGNSAHDKVLSNHSVLRVRMHTNLENIALPIQFTYDPSPIDTSAGIIYAAVVLLGLYIMIIWEVVHRTFAAILASTMSIAILAAFNEKPSMTELMSWIDVETLLLLFGMMILVAILSETGIFDYLAVYAYKITGGKVWPLIYCLCIFTAVMSSFLDNVTTVLLMTPVSIRLCEVMGLNPVPILMSMIIYSNVGGAMTPVGDPPNVIIASNSIIAKSVSFHYFLYSTSMLSINQYISGC